MEIIFLIIVTVLIIIAIILIVIFVCLLVSSVIMLFYNIYASKTNVSTKIKGSKKTKKANKQKATV